MIFKTFLAPKMSVTVITRDTCIFNYTWWTLMTIATDLVTYVCYVTPTTYVTSLTHTV
jgi:hypothetical protein